MNDKKHLVVLTGAGISAESGLKTFRDSNGLWMGYDIEEVATPQGFAKNPQLVLDFYNMRRREVKLAKPNLAHIILAELESHFNVSIVTQNIDDLHERAGSSTVMHLHGEIFKMHSIKNEANIYEINEDINVGDFASDGGQLRPHIVWFNEPVPMIERAAKLMATADIFLLVGTSLQVYPAAGLLDYVPTFAPKYIVDKHIPSVQQYQNIIPIEKTATEGMQEFKRVLLANNKT
jgi:NAD-dependent deacetylase